VTLENPFLRVQILPEAGAKVWQITYKPLDVDLLWNNPLTIPARQSISACYDDVWSGGWDELFPNDEVATIAGRTYPDHGELWIGQWKAEPFENAGEAGVRLTYLTPISSIRVEKKVVLPRGEAQLRFSHTFTNLGDSDFPFLWKLHPAFEVTPQHRIDFPPMRVTLEPAFPGTLAGAPPAFPWPHAPIGAKTVDLRRIPPESEQQLYFFYGTELRQGWCALTNTATHLSAILQFDPGVFPCCWLFASYGGWRDYNVAVLEPCTGYPLDFAAMQAAGRHKTLPAKQQLTTEVVFSVHEGIRSVGGLSSDGKPEEAAV
jgi:hypothetical protein